MNTFLWIGLIGLGIVILVNVVAILAFNKPEALVMADWWSTWYANYVVWFVFIIIGLGQKLSGKNKHNNSSSR